MLSTNGSDVPAGSRHASSSLPVSAASSFTSLAILLLLASISVIVLWLLIGHVTRTAELADSVTQARWGLLPLAVLAACSNLLAAALRWKLALRALGVSVAFRRCLVVMLAAFPFIVLAPMKSNELLRALPLKDDVPPLVCMISVAVERVVDVIVLLLLTLVGSLLLGRWHIAIATGVLLAGGAAVGLRLVPALHRMVRGRRTHHFSIMSGALASLRARPLSSTAVLAASVVAWLAACALILILLGVFGVSVGIGTVLVAWPLAVLVGVLPISLAGMGTRDAAFVFALGWTGTAIANPGAVVTSTLAYAALAIWLWVLVGLPFMHRHAAQLRASQVPRSGAGTDTTDL